ncbi:unnamed protein product [Nesidiocoris tenuis]|uniref:Uncharacterized protein n=1 Tax=Nesidiocoris tenuis TaxID=355587 RepID=A0A6H5HT35_9HEMI|nr:unnamed protein product [Nesidiocoris tenuis]
MRRRRYNIRKSKVGGAAPGRVLRAILIGRFCIRRVRLFLSLSPPILRETPLFGRRNHRTTTLSELLQSRPDGRSIVWQISRKSRRNGRLLPFFCRWTEDYAILLSVIAV